MGKHTYKNINFPWYKMYSRIKQMNHDFIYLWELILVWALWFAGLMMAWGTTLPNNSSFWYPLKQVSTLECRTWYRNDLPDSCKINLPIIHWANYSAYQDTKLYRDIYTTLRAAPYSDSWNQKIWAHGWVDIATARGTPLYSIWDWEVFSAWRNSAYGNLVRIKYVYKWEIVYAVYAHMDTINVKAWDKVSRWQKIWTVGNTWNTSGALWWYHVHFELAKDNFGRPAYAYTNCPDLSKWHYRIIQNGLCRNELKTYQYDPIKIFEAGSSYVPPIVDKPVEGQAPVGVNEWNNPNSWMSSAPSTENKAPVNNDWTNNTPSSNSSNSSTNNNLINKDSTNNSLNNISNNTSDNTTIKDDIQSNPSSDTLNDNLKHNSPSVSDENTSNSTNNSNSNESEYVEVEKDPLLVNLDFTWLKGLAEHFSRLWDIEMKTELMKKSLRLGETVKLDIEIFAKWKWDSREWNYYKNNVLQVPFEFVSSSDIVTLNVNSLQLVSKWKASIEITWSNVWKSSLVVKLWWQRVWILEITVK